MDRFKQRIKYYLVGFVIGLLIMFMIFGNRGCSWLPGNRVKNMIAEKEILIGDSLSEVMNCAGVTNTDIYALLNEGGDVNFSQSITNTYPKKYLFEGSKNDKPLSITYALYDSLAEVINFNFEGQTNCTSILSNKRKQIVPLPDADVRAIIESHELRILNKATCQMDCLGLTEEEVLNFHKTASFNVEFSKPRQNPNPQYVMKGSIRNTVYYITYIIGENRSRISDISPNTCNCAE
ncbi:MAG: hypothetical protein HYZ14_01045 [Bacteroidetes bacterium]|nr:hypothetical protein [Bacteroidota bacterium]